MSRKEGWVGRKSAFFEFFLREVSTAPPPGSPYIPQRWRPQPQRTRTACTSQATGQATPDRSHHWRAWSVSETEQICTHSNMNDFQHKNVCKTIDINTRTCYYIDNTRTCYTTTKQEDKNHETRI